MPQEFTLHASPQKQLRTAEGIAMRGEWTPVFTFENPENLNVVYLTQNGLYVRIFNIVLVEFWIEMSTFTHTTATGSALITGLPFPALVQTTSTIRAVGSCFFEGVTAAGYSQLTPSILPSESEIEFVLSGSGVAATLLNKDHMPSGGTPALAGAISYVAES